VSVLVIDVGTSSIRAVVADDTAQIGVDARRPALPSTPFPGLVEFDPTEMATVAVELARDVLERHGGTVDAVGITNQRASTVVWDPATGEPVGPGIGWQDLRTVGECLALQADGFRLAPNHAATKCAALLDAADADRTRGLLFGTVDTWLTWVLSDGSAHVTDLTNASVTGLMALDGSGWDAAVLDRLRIPLEAMPQIVDSAGPCAEARMLPGSPAIAALVGDQQASLVGQGCVSPGSAKITFGTGGMLDLWLGADRPGFDLRGERGTFPLVALGHDGAIQWGLEGVMLAAGTNVEWLRDDLGVIDSAAASHDLASGCETSDGVVFVPALLGLGTPHWDYGARGGLFGVTRGTTAAHLARAVLEGVAQRGADLVDAAEHDGGVAIDVLRVDGGMSANPTFVQALADATQRPVELSPEIEATSRGAALLALVGTGRITVADADGLWSPRDVVAPGDPLDRQRWADAVGRAREWHGELSAMDF
jgi:glycerol kinase